MDTFAQVSDKDVSDKSFIQYDASGKVIRTSSAEDLVRGHDVKGPAEFYSGV